MLIKCSSKGDLSKMEKKLKKMLKHKHMDMLRKYGELGVKSLAYYTPKDSGETSSLWSYDIRETDTGYAITWNNDNVNDGVNIALLIQHGHGLRGGGWVEGTDYINPAMRPVFEGLAKEAWEELSKL